jgi:hypothetical protein
MSEGQIKEITKRCTRLCMIRAADVIDGLTEEDVLSHQAALMASGVPLEKLARVDRALVASCIFRAMAEELDA